jgi:hypothetical protein
MVAIISTDQPAAASCARPGPLVEVLELVDGAFVGELISQEPSPRRGYIVYTFRVEEALKGDIGAEIKLRSSVPLANGLMVEEGVRYGLFVWGGEGSWSSSGCDQLYSDELLREVALASAAATEPPPPAKAPAPSAAARASLMWLWVSLATGVSVLAIFLARRRARHAQEVP